MVQRGRAPDPGIGSLINIADWHALHGVEVFSTRSALEWFVRRHRDELIREDVYLPRKGRAGSLVDSARFGRVAREILRREALGVRAQAQGAAA